MAISGRSRPRTDWIALGASIVLALVARALPTGPRDAVASGLRSTVVSPLVVLQKGAERWRGAWLAREREQLAADSAAMRAIAERALRSENEQLRRLIGLARRVETGFIPAEALQPPTETDFLESIILTAGSNAGVRRFSPVIAPEGLVGKVEKADPTMSIAILYTHPNFRASAMSADGAAFGIIYPHRATGVGRDREYLLELRNVAHRTELKPGTQIVTTDLGGTFPAGVPVGTVLREIRNSAATGLSRTYLVTPAVTIARLSSVLILDPERAPQGIGNLWTAAVSRDSAERGIVAAGDSLARIEVELLARAREAARDSLKRATADSIRRLHGLPPDSAAADSIARARAAAVVPPTGRVGAPLSAPRRPAAIRDTTRRDTIRPPDTVRVRPDTIDPTRSPAAANPR